jgi:putative ABC transport system permease protein
VAIVSLLLGAAVASLLLNLYSGARRKMTQEFRAYGPNVVLAPAPTEDSDAVGGVMEQDVVSRVQPFRQRVHDLTALPILYAVIRLKRTRGDLRLPEFENVVAVGADFAALQRLYPGWRVDGVGSWPDSGHCVIGAHLAARLHTGVGDNVELQSIGTQPLSQPHRDAPLPFRGVCRISAVLSTGASEDEQLFVPLHSLQRLAGLEGRISLVELSVPGETAEVERIVRELSRDLKGFDVRPIRQIVYSEGRVLETIRWLSWPSPP